jgi:group I intron endonuclease
MSLQTEVKKISGVYRITSKVYPFRDYIGSAINITDRWRLHLSDLKFLKHGNKRLQNHYNKYGESDLQFSIIVGCPIDDLIKTEQFYIDAYDPYFNICKIAGSRLGTKQSEETKRKLSESAKKRKASDETRRKISEGGKGRIGGNLGNKGKYRHSQERKDKISAAAKLRFATQPERIKAYSERLKKHPIHKSKSNG